MLVQTSEELRIWNELMIAEHPLGAGPLVGRQLRYLIDSQHGWLGGFRFAAPALQLADRDRWIGWDRKQLQAYLHVVVAISRFLLRPSVQCHNLASKVLSMSMAVVADDFERKYHYRPLLIERFVDLDHYSGTCYQAANWIGVGKTKGRGSYKRTRLTKHGFPRGYLMREKSVYGFQTGDMIRAIVSTGKKEGTWLGRVAIRKIGSFNIQTSDGAVQGIHHRHCQLMQRADGYGYHLQPTPQKGGGKQESLSCYSSPT